MEIKNKILQTELVVKEPNLKIFAKHLEVDKKSIQNYAKLANEKNIVVKDAETRGVYLAEGFMKLFYILWKDAEDKLAKKLAADNAKESNYRLKNWDMILSIKQRAGELAKAEDTRLSMSYITKTANDSINRLMNEILTDIRDVITPQIDKSIRTRFKDLIKLLGTLKPPRIDDNHEAFLEQDFILTTDGKK